LSFFNFIKNNIDQEFRNPCDTPMLKKLFRARPSYHWNIIEKETVDEIIFRTSKPRNRLILELMARGGMRISEVLKLSPSDVNGRRLTLKDPKSGREQEFVFIPQKLADRLKDYIRQKGIQPHQRIFPICYEASREMVAKAGKNMKISSVSEPCDKSDSSAGRILLFVPEPLNEDFILSVRSDPEPRDLISIEDAYRSIVDVYSDR